MHTPSGSIIDSVRSGYHTLIPHRMRRALHRMRYAADFRAMRYTVQHSSKGTFSLRNCDARRAIFVHTPKAAGTSVALAVFGELPYHFTAADYQFIFGQQDYDAYFSFTFVRNPWDRLFSAFHFLKSGGWDEKDHAWAESHLKEFPDFATFVRMGLRLPQIQRFMHFRPQADFVCDWRGTVAVDHIGYFETIGQDFAAICAHLSIESDLQHTNRSTDRDYRGAFDSEMIAIVAHHYAQDIRTFGYSFDGLVQRQCGRRQLSVANVP
jgi:hypothetical protein